MGLRRIKGNALFDRLGEGCNLGHDGRRWQAGAADLRQARQQARGDGVGLRARDGAHHADARAAGHHAGGMRRLHVGHADLRQRRLGHLVAVRVRAVHRRGKGAPGQRGGAGVGLLERGLHALAFALPDGLGKRRLGDLARRQRHRLVQQRGIGQRAQRKIHAVRAGAGAELRAQIGPGLAQRVFVHRQSALFSLHALVQHARRHARQTRLAGRVAPAAGVKINLHIQHGDGRAFDQINLGAARLRPVLDGDRRHRKIVNKKACSA